MSHEPGLTEAKSMCGSGDYLEVAPGIEIYYEDVGEGPPLVFVTGWTFTTKVFCHQFAHFAETNRVIAFDPRSHGRSTTTLEGNNYITQGADLAKLLAHLNVTDPVLVGWSAGCLTNWQYVREHGTEGVKGNVSIDLSPTPMTGVDGDWVEGSVADLAGFFQGVQTSQGQRDIVKSYADEVMIEQELTPELTKWVVEQSLSTPPMMAAAYIADVAFSNYLEEARKIDAEIPSLFVVANHWADTAKTYLAKHAPNSQIEAFGGHMMFWEHHERFNSRLAEFLAGIE